jgi:hypothetical protein
VEGESVVYEGWPYFSVVDELSATWVRLYFGVDASPLDVED